MRTAKTRQEIERKFLVLDESWRKKATGPAQIEQGYLARGRKSTIRIRIKDRKHATLTVKSREAGASRAEFEYRISLKDAKLMMELCGPSHIEKQRFTLPQGKLTWEIDVFGGRHQGLVMAEVELPDADEAVRLPAWVGEEVTADPRYRNSSLVGID